MSQGKSTLRTGMKTVANSGARAGSEAGGRAGARLGAKHKNYSEKQVKQKLENPSDLPLLVDEY